MPTELPNLSRLIKLLKMTTTSNDHEALSFMRKANEELAKFGGDWETILRSRITVIGEDPFSAIPEPPKRETAARPQYNPVTTPPTYNPPPKRPQAAPQYSRPSPPAAFPNRYTGSCFCCGIPVAAQSGITEKINNKWEVICSSCKTTSFRPVRRTKPKAANLNFVLDSLEKGI